MKATVTIDGTRLSVELVEEDGDWIAVVDGQRFPIRQSRRGLHSIVNVADSVYAIDTESVTHPRIDGTPTSLRIETLVGVAGAPDPTAGQHGPVLAPMTGKLESILVSEGQQVSAGDVLFVLEAMKMRNEIKAGADGVVANIQAAPGDAVDSRQPILVLDPQ